VPNLGLRKYLTDNWNESELEEARARRVAVLQVEDHGASGVRHRADTISDDNQLKQLMQKLTSTAVKAINQRLIKPHANNNRSSSGHTYSNLSRSGRLGNLQRCPTVTAMAASVSIASSLST
jgi:hypothetical protein